MHENRFERPPAEGVCDHGNVPRMCSACSQRRERLFDHILTPDEEYVESAKRKGNETIRIEKDGKEIVVHGTDHVFSKAPIADIVASFERENPDLLVVEGTAKVDIDPTMSGDEILERYGEQQYFRWLAKEKGLEVRSWDVPWVDRFREAFKSHDRDAVLGWTIAYATKLLFERNGGKRPTEDEVRATIKLALDHETVAELQQEFPDLDLNVDSIDVDAIMQEVTGGTGLNDIDVATAEDLGTPWHEGRTNDVIRDMVLQRDRHAVSLIDEERWRHKKMFVIAGNDHVIAWEPALKKMQES